MNLTSIVNVFDSNVSREETVVSPFLFYGFPKKKFLVGEYDLGSDNSLFYAMTGSMSHAIGSHEENPRVAFINYDDALRASHEMHNT